MSAAVEYGSVKSVTMSAVVPNVLGHGFVRDLVIKMGGGEEAIVTLRGDKPADLAFEHEMRLPVHAD